LTHVRRWSGGQSLRHQHALGVFSARPTEVATAATGAGSGALWLVETSRSGLAVVEAYAVMRGRHGDPVRKFAAYRPPRGTRVLASVDSADLSASVRRRGSLWPHARRGRVHGSRGVDRRQPKAIPVASRAWRAVARAPTPAVERLLTAIAERYPYIYLYILRIACSRRHEEQRLSKGGPGWRTAVKNPPGAPAWCS
jgi:hypothetical protein